MRLFLPGIPETTVIKFYQLDYFHAPMGGLSLPKLKEEEWMGRGYMGKERTGRQKEVETVVGM